MLSAVPEFPGFSGIQRRLVLPEHNHDDGLKHRGVMCLVYPSAIYSHQPNFKLIPKKQEKRDLHINGSGREMLEPWCTRWPKFPNFYNQMPPHVNSIVSYFAKPASTWKITKYFLILGNPYYIESRNTITKSLGSRNNVLRKDFTHKMTTFPFPHCLWLACVWLCVSQRFYN